MKTSRKNKKHISNIAEKGFTLVELLIVVIILAILAAIVVPQFASTTDDARDSAADSTLAGMRSAIDLYYQQHNSTYPGAVTAAPGTGLCGTGTKGVGDASNAANQAAAFLEQLSLYTDALGGACSVSDATTKFGPYLKKPDIPADPFLGVAALVVVEGGDLDMAADASGPGGFKYDIKTGKIIINIPAEEKR